jgi:monovalent cation/proton antiporter MnhG/PhaG subunit
MKTILIEAFLAAGVLTTLLSVLGMARMRDPYQQMHYISPPASLSAIFITLAIFLQQGMKPESFKAVLVTLVLIAMNTIVTHEAARGFRIAEVSDWRPKKGEEAPLKASDELVAQEPDS